MTHVPGSGIGFGRPDRTRSELLVKALLYRLLMVLLTVAVAFLVTHDSGSALQIGIVTNVVKTGTYYAYDRFWSRLAVGG
ncbi:MAG: DUF2061 domain-containing protein [Halodesulfurarchaeum sp.]